jgi:hypothetical protein
MLNAGRIVLPKSDRLVNQLCGLERRVARSGKDSIDHSPGGHDDVANAVAGAAEYACERRKHQPPRVFNGWTGEEITIRPKSPHEWDGPLPGGGYATAR